MKKKIKQKTKLFNKKIIMFLGILIIIIIAIFEILFLPNLKSNDEFSNKSTPLEQNKTDENKSNLTYYRNDDCVSYIEKAEEVNYDTLLESEYSSTLYKYDSDEDNEYYLVCLTDIKYNDKDLTESIENKDLTIEELDTILKEQELDSLKVVRDIKESEESQEEKDDEEDEKETSSSTDKNTSSNSSSNSSSSSSSNSNKNNTTSSSSSSNSNSSSSSSKPSSGTTTSSKEKDNATLKKQLAAAGLSWDFNTKAEAEAFMKKWMDRGFTAGYYINNYGDSDTAYSGYVQILAVNFDFLSSNLNVDWHNETPAMYDEIYYLHSLGYDCTGYCTRDFICY